MTDTTVNATPSTVLNEVEQQVKQDTSAIAESSKTAFSSIKHLVTANYIAPLLIIVITIILGAMSFFAKNSKMPAKISSLILVIAQVWLVYAYNGQKSMA